MERYPMKIGVLTSSRADYGIYLPLLKALYSDPFFELQMLVFGSHLSNRFDYTIKQIEIDGFSIGQKLHTLPESDKPHDISRAMAMVINEFSNVWENNSFDLIFALGDRYEMFAAVSSTLPFNIPVAHIHGGETTLGAIDNAFRHSITSMSKLHFTTCEVYKNRVVEITGSNDGVYNVGALSIDVLENMKFLSIDEFYQKYKIDLRKPTVLFTFQPETVNYERNEEYIKIMVEVLLELKKTYQVVITMPNADTANNIIRKHLDAFIHRHQNVYGIESFGSLGYLSCMKYCSFMLGNTSSGFVEASWFPKAVINVGERQKGRIETPNISTCRIEKHEILDTIKFIKMHEYSQQEKLYGKGNASKQIIMILKELTPFT